MNINFFVRKKKEKILNEYHYIKCSINNSLIKEIYIDNKEILYYKKKFNKNIFYLKNKKYKIECYIKLINIHNIIKKIDNIDFILKNKKKIKVKIPINLVNYNNKYNVNKIYDEIEVILNPIEPLDSININLKKHKKTIYMRDIINVERKIELTNFIKEINPPIIIIKKKL
ncbi:hypothetical protein [Candidatus Vidania fulgoroideorum]